MRLRNRIVQCASRFGDCSGVAWLNKVRPAPGAGRLEGPADRHADRRRNVLELTTDGQTALVRAVRASDEAERQLLAELDDAESAQLRTLLTRLGPGPLGALARPHSGPAPDHAEHETLTEQPDDPL
jgi:hypothetical protein